MRCFSFITREIVGRGWIQRAAAESGALLLPFPFPPLLVCSCLFLFFISCFSAFLVFLFSSFLSLLTLVFLISSHLFYFCSFLPMLVFAICNSKISKQTRNTHSLIRKLEFKYSPIHQFATTPSCQLICQFASLHFEFSNWQSGELIGELANGLANSPISQTPIG